MSGKQQYSNDVYDSIVELYSSGEQMAAIQNKIGVARNTIYTALRARGVQMRKASRKPREENAQPRAAKVPSQRGAMSPDAAYDRLAKVEESPCQCGGNCGLTFRKVIGQRSRLYAKDCPVQKENNRRKNAEYAAKAKKRRLAAAPPRNLAKGRVPDPTPRRAVKICKTCCNLPHARKNPVCPECRMPFVETPSLKDHAELSVCRVGFTEEEESSIANAYVEGMTLRDIYSKYGSAFDDIYRIIGARGIKRQKTR